MAAFHHQAGAGPDKTARSAAVGMIQRNRDTGRSGCYVPGDRVSSGQSVIDGGEKKLGLGKACRWRLELSAPRQASNDNYRPNAPSRSSQRSFGSGASRPPSCSFQVYAGLVVYLFRKRKFPNQEGRCGSWPWPGSQSPPLGRSRYQVAVDSIQREVDPCCLPASVPAARVQQVVKRTSRRKRSTWIRCLPIQASTYANSLSPAPRRKWCGCVDPKAHHAQRDGGHLTNSPGCDRAAIGQERAASPRRLTG